MINIATAAFLFALHPATTTSTAVEAQVEPTHAKIRKLRKQRRDVLKQLVAMQKKAIRAGQATPEVLLKSSNELAEAELELATDEKEIASILEKNYKLFVDIEKLINARVRAGVGSPADLLAIKARRLKAEIRWLSAKSDAE